MTRHDALLYALSILGTFVILVLFSVFVGHLFSLLSGGLTP